MTDLTKRTTIYLDHALYRALKRKAGETLRSLSRLVNDAVKSGIARDADDLATFENRAKEQTLSLQRFIRQLKRDGKL